MRYEDIFIAAAVKISRISAHPRLRHTIAVDGDSSEERFVLECAVFLVDPELVRVSVVGDVNIHPPVTVEVGSDHTQSVTELVRDACGGGDVLESSVAFIMKQPVPRRAERARSAIVLHGRLCVAGWTPGKGKVGVVNHHQVEPSVSVVIKEGGARAPPGIVRS